MSTVSWPALSIFPLFLSTFLLPSFLLTTFVKWTIWILTFSILFRSVLGPKILQLLSKRLRVQSVSLRSIRGVYFRSRKVIVQVDRVGLGYHKPSQAKGDLHHTHHGHGKEKGGSASRFSIKVQGLRVQLLSPSPASTYQQHNGHSTSHSHAQAEKPRSTSSALLTPLRVHLHRIYLSLEPYLRPLLRASLLYGLRIVIRALPFITQALDLELDSASVTSQAIPGAELALKKAKFHVNLTFTQLDNSLPHSHSPERTLASQRHRRFASVVDLNTRVKNSMRRTWDRAWGTTHVSAGVRLDVEQLLGLASGPLLQELNLVADDQGGKYTFLVVPTIGLNTSLRLDPSQRPEPHSVEVNLALSPTSIDINVLQHILSVLQTLKKQHEFLNSQMKHKPDGLWSPSASPPLSPRSSIMFSPLASSIGMSPLNSGMSIGMSPVGAMSPISPLSPPGTGATESRSPLRDALSMRWKWGKVSDSVRKHHPVRKVHSSHSRKKSKSTLSVIKALHFELPSLTLIHRPSSTSPLSSSTYITINPISPPFSSASAFPTSATVPPSPVPSIAPSLLQPGQESLKVTIEKVRFAFTLSHPDRVELHREMFGRTSAPGDPLTADVYALRASLASISVDRVRSGADPSQFSSHLRLVQMGGVDKAVEKAVSATVLVSGFPGQWLKPVSFLGGDPNASVVGVRIGIGRVEIVERVEVVQAILRRAERMEKDKVAADGVTGSMDNNANANSLLEIEPVPLLPPILSPVPRISFGLHTGDISIKLISSGFSPSSVGDSGSGPFAIEAKTGGVVVTGETSFRVLADAGLGTSSNQHQNVHGHGHVHTHNSVSTLPIDPDRPRVRMSLALSANVESTFVFIHHASSEPIVRTPYSATSFYVHGQSGPISPAYSMTNDQYFGGDTLGGAVYPGEPVMQIGRIGVSAEGWAWGDYFDPVHSSHRSAGLRGSSSTTAGITTIDVETSFAEVKGCCEAISVELWQVDSVRALAGVLAMLSPTPKRESEKPLTLGKRPQMRKRGLVERLPVGMSASFSVGKCMVFVTGPDLAPKRDEEEDEEEIELKQTFGRVHEPGEDEEISRGISIHAGMAVHYCAVQPQHQVQQQQFPSTSFYSQPSSTSHIPAASSRAPTSFQTLLHRTQQRLQLSLPSELLATAYGSASASAATGTKQAFVQGVIWGVGIRDVVAGRWIAGDPFEDWPIGGAPVGFGPGAGSARTGRRASRGYGRDEEDEEWLKVGEVRADIVLSGRIGNGMGNGTEKKDEMNVNVNVNNVSGTVELAHVYGVLLAVEGVKRLFPEKHGKKSQEGKAKGQGQDSSLTITLRAEVDTVKLLWNFPLKMRMYTRIKALSASILPQANGQVGFGWDSVLLAVPVDVTRYGETRVQWEELARIVNLSASIQPHTKPVNISVTGHSARLRIPFGFVLADLILSINLTLKSIKHLVKMVPERAFFQPPPPEAEEPKKMPELSLRLGCLMVEAADDGLESRMGLVWRAGLGNARVRLEREEAFEAKVTTIKAAARKAREAERYKERFSRESRGGDTEREPSTPMREAESEFQFTAEHTVTVNEARERLNQVHSGAWKSRFRQARVHQVRREDVHLRKISPKGNAKLYDAEVLNRDLVRVNEPETVPPLIRLSFDQLALRLSQPKGFQATKEGVREYLYHEGGGLPKETDFSLLLPMHLAFTLGAWRVSCREYPLPLIHIPAHSQSTPTNPLAALSFTSDLVVAEELPPNRPLLTEWFVCPVLPSNAGMLGAPELKISIPKTINPVKTYANPVIKVKTDGVTDFGWGVSYGPVTQDVMRVVDTLSHAPRDSSPAIGFWDKLRLVFHWRIQFLFEHEVHLHFKGNHNPHSLSDEGAGFALCWQGNPKLLVNQGNDQGELIQVISDRMLITIPNIEESYGESSTLGPMSRSQPSLGAPPPRKSRKIVAKFDSGVRFGFGFVLERTCGPECNKCTGSAFDRQCRSFDFKPHYDVVLERKEKKPAEKSPEDSYNGFRSDYIHLSVSLTSSTTGAEDKFSSIHLSPAVFKHFFAWWSLFGTKGLPIRQGKRYKHKRPLSPKFGQHLATIKYRIEIPRLFISHVYMDQSQDAWKDGVTPFVGIKAMARKFQADMHQRAQESTVTGPDGTTKTIIHKPFYAVEVVAKNLEVRALLAIFAQPLKQYVEFPADEPPPTSSYRSRENIPAVDITSEWVDFDDFREIEWDAESTPVLHVLPAASCPSFTYFKRAPISGMGDAKEGRVECTKFGDEDTHVCLLGKEASVPQIQMEIARNRIEEIRCKSAKDFVCPESSPTSPTDTNSDYMISLLEDYTAHLRRVEAESRSSFSNGGRQSYYMPSDTVSPDEWAEFDHVYQVHCPRVFLDNIIRDIMLQYYYCSRITRGIEYHMATRAVKFIRDQAEAAISALQHEEPDHEKHRGAAASAQAAALALRKILTSDSTTNTSSATPGTMVEVTQSSVGQSLDNQDPLRGWSKGVSLQKSHFLLLLKPQISLRSETSAEAVCVLAAVQGKSQAYHIIDDANKDDPVSGHIMTRNFASLTGLQAFCPSAINKTGQGVVPLEVLIDLRCGSNYFDRLIPQTDAALQYDKFNRLRLRNSVTSVAQPSQHTDDLHNHLHSQNDLVRFHIPRFTVTADGRHFQAISNIVTNLLLFSNAAHKTRSDRLEKMLFSYDFTNLSSVADVVAKLQSRLRLAVETKREAEWKLSRHGEAGEIEKLKIEAHILRLAEELDYVFEAIQLAQDKSDDQSSQKSALLLHASSSEISWRMLDRHDQLLAKLAVRNIDFRWLNRQDSSTVNHLSVGDLQAFDGAADADWTEILSKHDEPASHPLVKRKLFCVADWIVLPPVGGITIYEAFELMLHPMRLQIDTRVGAKIMQYVWPERRKRFKERGERSPDSDETRFPPSSPSSPVSPGNSRMPLPLTPIHGPPTLRSTKPGTPTRRVSEDLPSPRMQDSNRLGVPSLRKVGTSRSFTDLRKAAADSLSIPVPSLHKTRSTDALFTLSMSNSSGQMSKVSEDSRDRLTLPRGETDDATVMKTRSSQKTFIWVKVSSLHLLLSIMKENSFLCRDARITTRDLEYRNQTSSFEELVEQFIPAGGSWKGWLKMAFNQPLVPVLPVARELISKTKWGTARHAPGDNHRRGTGGTITSNRFLPFISQSREGTLGFSKRQRTVSSKSSDGGAINNPSPYKGKNFSTLGLITTEPEPINAPQGSKEGKERHHKRNMLGKVFKRRRTKSSHGSSIDSTSSVNTTWTGRSSAGETESPPLPQSHSDNVL